MSTGEKHEQKALVRFQLLKRINEISELIPSSPEDTAALTFEVALAILQKVEMTLDNTAPLLARIEARLGSSVPDPKQIGEKK